MALHPLDQEDNYITCHDGLTDLEEIGKGGSGVIYKAKWKNLSNDCNNSTVALKFIKDEKDNEIYKEVQNYLIIQNYGTQAHPNILKYYGATKGKGKLCLILEYAHYNLREYLRNNSNLKWYDRIHIAKDIAFGLKFLHKNNTIHRDLHTENILVHIENRKATVKIADFGRSSHSSSSDLDNSNSKCYGTIAFIEPKLLRCLDGNSYNLDKRSDIYSAGVIFWEISSGRPPFEFVQQHDLILRINDGAREISEEGTPTEYIRIYELCWDDDPQNRPSAFEAYEMLNVLEGRIF
ncbi:kinase-like domain-containing protein [Gigaspora rosea]|uniref:Kinase-like domain-containing protein n=1 Tax=Gigaspora rosea TaxID=44941 RepID=A0A397VP82_9GLOM|nr:kinase-like domain-containing protein [Gigaspora rosea]